MLMNLQGWGRCPGVELAAECELSPRGEGANKTQHNTNRPLGRCEPTSQSASRLGWQRSPLWKPVKGQWRVSCPKPGTQRQRSSDMCCLSGGVYQQNISKSVNFVPDRLSVLEKYWNLIQSGHIAALILRNSPLLKSLTFNNTLLCICRQI